MLHSLIIITIVKKRHSIFYTKLKAFKGLLSESIRASLFQDLHVIYFAIGLPTSFSPLKFLKLTNRQHFNLEKGSH